MKPTPRTSDTTDVRVEKAPVGYSIILPPGWKRIPLRNKREMESAADALVSAACRQVPENLPRDFVARYRLEIRRRLGVGIKNARKSGGLDFYLPIAQPGEPLIAASFVVGEVSSADSDRGQFLTAMTSGAGYEPVDVDDSPGVRRELVMEADPTEDIEMSSRRVDYVVAVPKNLGRWVTISFSTMGGGDPSDDLADATVSLFDAIVTTFRWSNE